MTEPTTDPVDAFLNMLPGTLGDDIEIVAALDRLIASERAEARATADAEIRRLLERFADMNHDHRLECIRAHGHEGRDWRACSAFACREARALLADKREGLRG